MSISVIVITVCAALCLSVAALSLRIGSAPGHAEHRWLAAVAATAFVHTALGVVSSAPGQSSPAQLVPWASSLQLASLALHAIAWGRYARAVLGAPGALDRPFEWMLAAVAALSLTPGLAFTAVEPREVPLLAAHHLGYAPTALGQALLAAVAAALALTAMRLLAAWRRAIIGVRVQGVALAVITALVVHDALVISGRLASPLLVDLVLVVPVAALGWVITSRFVADARALEALRRGLQEAVTERTEALHRTQEALGRTEKLAAVGQFAAGLAHQVNNPLSAIAASLAYLAEALPERPDADLRSALDDAQAALARIGGVTRRLRDASRLAASPSHPGAATQLAGAVREAIAVARRAAASATSPRPTASVPVDVSVPATLWAAAENDLVVEVIANLVVNGLEAMSGRAGGVRVTAHVEGDRVRLCVEDDGTGMEPDVLRRVFEPFFSTKRDPSASGLGLAVSRGLVVSAGGDLSVESSAGRGTRAWVELPAGAPPEEP